MQFGDYGGKKFANKKVVSKDGEVKIIMKALPS